MKIKRDKHPTSHSFSLDLTGLKGKRFEIFPRKSSQTSILARMNLKTSIVTSTFQVASSVPNQCSIQFSSYRRHFCTKAIIKLPAAKPTAA